MSVKTLWVVSLMILASAGLAQSQDCLELEGHWAEGTAHALATSGSTVYLGNGAELVIYDVASPASPQVVGRHTLPGAIWTITAAGDHLYLTDRATGLWIVDISDPANPVTVGWYAPAITAPPYDVAISGNYAVVALKGWGVEILDISDPSEPARIGGIWLDGVDFIFDIQVVGDLMGWTDSML